MVKDGTVEWLSGAIVERGSAVIVIKKLIKTNSYISCAINFSLIVKLYINY